MCYGLSSRPFAPTKKIMHVVVIYFVICELIHNRYMYVRLYVYVYVTRKGRSGNFFFSIIKSISARRGEDAAADRGRGRRGPQVHPQHTWLPG